MKLLNFVLSLLTIKILLDMNQELEELRKEVERNNTIDASANALIKGLADKLDKAIAANDWQGVKELTTSLRSSNDQLSTAITANTPAGETTPGDTVNQPPADNGSTPGSETPTPPLPEGGTLPQ